VDPAPVGLRTGGPCRAADRAAAGVGRRAADHRGGGCGEPLLLRGPPRGATAPSGRRHGGDHGAVPAELRGPRSSVRRGPAGISRGVDVAPITLHAGVSSLEEHEAPPAEFFRVSTDTARRVNDAVSGGGRVIAVGTTVVRALESAAAEDGRVGPAQGWTEIVVS